MAFHYHTELIFLAFRQTDRAEHPVENIGEPSLKHLNLDFGDRHFLGPVINDGSFSTSKK